MFPLSVVRMLSVNSRGAMTQKLQKGVHTIVQPSRQKALRKYIVFRIKAIEFLDILALFRSLRSISMSQEELTAVRAQVPPALTPLVSFFEFRPPRFAADSLRTVAVSWFALFIDTNGMDAIELWSEVFPQYADQTQEAWKRMKPEWNELKGFRDSAGFHADKPTRFFGARFNLRKEWPKVESALREFDELLRFFLKAERELASELEAAPDSLLDELEVAHGAPFKREQFKAYLMLEEFKALPSAAAPG